ncbi:MAG: polyprenyl synthetase family protein [Rubrivivax sp.]|nr:polyprenyl synthetase family protein [Rubrivivax sp.]
MDALNRIEQALETALALGTGDGNPGCPPKLAAGLRHAVFPGGARIRPQLCLAVARACGDADPRLADGAAAALELLHCASLVHDDLPCFDDAPLRRGIPSVHAAYGERIAVLAGDALIVLAFQMLAHSALHAPARLPGLMGIVARRVALPSGIIAGQAWECEPYVALPAYQRAKTGSLFAACTEAGAWAGGGDPADWQPFGLCLGEAYQVADDIRDVALAVELLGKPQGRDVALCRPSAATEMGLSGAIVHFDALLERAVDAIPACTGAAMLRAIVRSESERLVPQATVRDLALAA